MSRKFILLGIVKDEGQDILEWIAYYQMIGFGRIIIYDNESTDGSGEWLERLALAGEIELVKWPWPVGAKTGPQLPAYRDALAGLAKNDDWLCILDADEFLHLKEDRTIGEFVARFPRADSIGLNWRLFGSSGQKTRTPGLLIERFVRCDQTDSSVSRTIKSITKVSAIRNVQIHYCDIDGVFVNETGEEMHPAAHLATASHKLAQVNHYFTKSEQEWLRKRARGKADRSLTAGDKIRLETEFKLHDRNQEEDHGILAHVPTLAQRMLRLCMIVLTGRQDNRQRSTDAA